MTATKTKRLLATFKEALLKAVRFLRNWIKDNVLSPILGKLIVGVFGLIVALSALAIVTFEHIYDFQDEDSERGAATVQHDIFGDDAKRIVYLPQGWGPADSLWFYKTPQGSNMLPYDLFMALEQAGTSISFRSNENMNFYRYLPQKPTSSNPDGLPVGFVKETYKGKDFIGLTCAACHTTQINYRGSGIRIDGGPA